MFKIKKVPRPIFFLYALRCPLEKTFKYIGLTMNPEIRLKQHISDLSYNKYKSDWMQYLKNQNLTPDFVIIESFTDRKEASKKEIECINLHRSTLLNGQKGIISYPVIPISSSLEDMVEVTFTIRKEQLEKLQDIVDRRTEVFDSRSEKWQESDKGEEFEFKTQDIEGAIDELDLIIDNLKNT